MLLPLFFTLSVCLCQLSHCRTLREAPEGSYISEKQRLRHLRSSRERPGWLAERESSWIESWSPTGGEAREPDRRELHALDGQCRLFLISWGQRREIIFCHNRVLFGGKSESWVIEWSISNQTFLSLQICPLSISRTF